MGPLTDRPIVDRLREGALMLVRPTGPLPRPTRRNLVFDAVLAVAVWVAIMQYGFGDEPNPLDKVAIDRVFGPVIIHTPEPFHDPVKAMIIAVLASAPLVLRRRYPLGVFWLVLGALLIDPEQTPKLTLYACIIAAYSAATYSPYRAPMLISLLAMASSFTLMDDPPFPSLPDGQAPFLILVPIVVAANAIRGWRRRADEGRARMATLEREQAEALRRAAEHERARIARELHDVVTHNVSMMVIQAGAARKVLSTAPEQASEALLAVEAGGRAAMAELRHVMGLLTMDTEGRPAGTADLAPQPDLERLGDLIGRVRATGVPIEFTVSGDPHPVPPGVSLAAYRVVQEALTNTVRHAAGAETTVRIDYTADQLVIEVADTGGTRDASAAVGNGRGLIGLRERLAVYGGTLQAGPRLSGGYRVRAVIPLAAIPLEAG